VDGGEDMAVDVPLLDQLFKKTAALPAIYWLPLTEEQVCERLCVCSCVCACSCVCMSVCVIK
jgi:hypothetical protein